MALIKKYYKLYRAFPDPDYVYFENIATSGTCYFSINKNGTPASTDLSYSFDKTTWTDIHDGGQVIIPIGSKLYLRSSTGFSSGESSNYYSFGNSQNCIVGGNLMTLIDYENANTLTNIPNYAFSHMFNQHSGGGLTINELHTGNATTIGNYSFSWFVRYSNLNGNLTSLFENVVSAGTNAFDSAFIGTSFNELPLFEKLTTVGEKTFWSAFQNMSNLRFVDFSKITTVGFRAFSSSFYGCSSLNEVKTPNISSWNTTNFDGWLNGVASTGVVSKPAGLTIPTDNVSGIPTGWTTEDY